MPRSGQDDALTGNVHLTPANAIERVFGQDACPRPVGIAAGKLSAVAVRRLGARCRSETLLAHHARLW